MADQEKPIARTPGAPRGDHEARRQEITEVAWRVIARDGLEQTSLRAIARELGLSTSIVTHYFKDKEELLLFALDQVQARLTRNLLTGVEKLQGLERLEYLLLEALPIKARATLPWQVWTAYVGYAVGHPKLMAEHRRRATEMRAILVKEIKSLQRQGILDAKLEPLYEAKILNALLDGMGIGQVIEGDCFTVAEQKRIIKRQLENLRVKK